MRFPLKITRQKFKVNRLADCGNCFYRSPGGFGQIFEILSESRPDYRGRIVGLRRSSIGRGHPGFPADAWQTWNPTWNTGAAV